jgi:hypothetical protein
MPKLLTRRELINKATKVHGNKYNYSKLTYNSVIDKVIIICKKHGEFKQRFNYHYSGGGCKKCANDRAVESIKYTREEFIKLSTKKHGKKYDYSNVIYKNVRTPVSIVCPIHGKFNQNPHEHMMRCGCPKCGIENRIKKRSNTKGHFVKVAKKVHGNAYDYSKSVYINNKVKVKIHCREHGEFWQTPNNHMRGHKCPTCAKLEKTSKGEDDFLSHIGIPKEQRQISLENYVVDGMDTSNNTIYEYLGDYWHGNPRRFPKNKKTHGGRFTCGELYKSTFLRFKKLKKMGYNVKYIWEMDWKSWKRGKLEKIPIKNFL